MLVGASLCLALLISCHVASAANLRQLSHARDEPEDSPFGPLICKWGDVEVRQRKGDERVANSSGVSRSRRQIVTSLSGVQSEVRCLIQENCADSEKSAKCGCPCVYDDRQPLYGHYMLTMANELSSICSAKIDAQVLVVGVGGGEIIHHLLHKCPTMHITGVDNNADMLQAAKEGFGLGKTRQMFPGHLRLVQRDALSMLLESQFSSYHAVLVDCFTPTGEVPESCRNEQFAKEVGRVLKPGGYLLQNIWEKSTQPQASWGTPFSQDAVSVAFEQTKAAYDKVFQGKYQLLKVPMPAGLDVVQVIKMQKTSDQW
eukprot:TRINITY_DN50257_c0_g1_i1.p1 TRINITY_DN50257_c0_g1~~TRINITY_DN50257_c0_g1_i1.p1  ORF type:complete len:315 (-),score=57.17 TRINITY_DN50257_c0_g1_i1:140-1084(-)